MSIYTLKVAKGVLKKKNQNEDKPAKTSCLESA